MVFLLVGIGRHSEPDCVAEYWDFVLTSGVIEFTKESAQIGRLPQIGLSVGALLTLAFLYGQSAAWEYFMRMAIWLTVLLLSFFYLLTGLHALHLVGGL